MWVNSPHYTLHPIIKLPRWILIHKMYKTTTWVCLCNCNKTDLLLTNTDVLVTKHNHYHACLGGLGEMSGCGQRCLLPTLALPFHLWCLFLQGLLVRWRIRFLKKESNTVLYVFGTEKEREATMSLSFTLWARIWNRSIFTKCQYYIKLYHWVPRIIIMYLLL